MLLSGSHNLTHVSSTPNIDPKDSIPPDTFLSVDQNQDMGAASRSFKDTLVNGNRNEDAMEVEDWIASKKVNVDFVNEGKTIPKISFTSDTLDYLSRPWRKPTVVAKFLGKIIGYQLFSCKVNLMWKPKEDMEILNFDHSCLLMKFDLEKDIEYALTEGPWVIQDHYLTMQRWPEFQPIYCSCRNHFGLDQATKVVNGLL